jgi:chemotaxis protein CheZ
MPAPRKIFRIEETVAARRTGAHQADARQASAHQADTHNIRDGMTAPDPHAEIMQALQTLRATFHATTPRLVASAADNASPLNAAQLARIGHELEAVVTGTAHATQKILSAAEEIDQLAGNLAASLKGKLERDAAQDISDLVIRIFEACNFQDLTGQHVAKVMTRLKAIEDGDKANAKPETPKPPSAGATLLHGPKLEHDSGHITQAEIDALFDKA